MFRLGHALAVQFKHQFRMTGFENVGVNILVARDAGIGADVKILQIAHSRRRAIGTRVILARVCAQPIFRRAVAAFTRNAFARFEIFTAQIFGNFVQRRMTSRAAGIGRRVFDLQRIGNLLRARGRKRGGGTLRMKIFQRPDEELALILSATAVAAGIGARIRAEKFWRRFDAMRGSGRQKNSGDKTYGWVTNCFTHGDKLVNGVAA